MRPVKKATRHQREHWASRLGFVLAAIGSAVGLGTLWKFPYVTGENGGGLFVLIYLACTIVIGIPVFIGELILGRRAQRGVVGIFASLSQGSPNWRLVGWLSVLSPLLILSYYDVVAGWGVNYVFLSLSQFWQGRSPDEIRDVFSIMASSGGVCLLFQFLFTITIVGMVLQGVRKGVEYWSRLMTMSLLVILLCLFLYALTLQGFGDAAHFVFSLDASRLRPAGFLEALGLAFFTLSLGQGVMLTYGSYLQGTEDIPKTAFIVAMADVIVSLLAALVIFPIIFTYNLPSQQGEGLVFQTLPVIFSQLPAPLLVSTIFFVLLCFTAFTSAIALLEVIVANLIDLYGWSRKKAALLSGLGVLILGIPSALARTPHLFSNWERMYGHNFFTTVDNLVNSWLLPISGLLTAIFVGWVLDKRVVAEEFHRGTGWAFAYPIWRITVRWIVPLGVFLFIVHQAFS